jgi:hypothetical protein
MLRFPALLLLLVCGLPPRAALADAPVSSGTTGALERLSVQSAGPGSANAQFDPVQDSNGQFQLRWLFQFYEFGDLSQELDILPVERTPDNWTSIVPQLEFGSRRGLYRTQFGVVSTSIGHGTIVRNFTNSPNGTDRRIGFYLSGTTPAGGFETAVGDFLDPGALLVARITLRPMVLLWTGAVRKQPVEFDHNKLAKPLGRWKTGFTIATDLTAPSEVGTWGTVAAIGFENEIIGIDDDRGRAVLYVDINGLTRIGGNVGTGTHIGAELSGTASEFQLQFKGDLNLASPGYIPGYFDQTYMIERLDSFGVTRPKINLDAPGSAGYLLMLSMIYRPYFSLFAQFSDQIPMFAGDGSNNIFILSGASASWFIFHGTVSMSQTGVTNYIQDAFQGAGLLFIAEGRISLFWSYLQMVGRYFSLNEPIDHSQKEFDTIAGGFLGLEVNLSF